MMPGLALTAEIECAISKATKNQPGGARPSTAVTAKELEVSSQLPKLLTSIEEETTFPENKFQAQVCVGWLHWVVGEYNLALVRLPKSLEFEYSQLDPVDKLSEWTNVCALKAAYLKANCLARNNQRVEALSVFESGLPSLAVVWGGHPARKQLRYCAELFLTEYCMVSSHALHENETPLDQANSLACFRSWARYWEALSGPLAGGHGFRGAVPRRRVWSEYYLALSTILEGDLPFPTGYVGKITNETSARNQLRVELKKVESAYEVLLLGETTFPRADEEREEVESFAKLVVKNWSILSGRGWRGHDLGQGGRENLSRDVLDVLYRAAMKTYHSTAILRYLFTVHLAVAEFELAFKAFDSYLAIVKKGKARVDKTGNIEPSLDEDGVVLETMSQCIVALCRFGGREAAEKARDLAGELEDWLARLPQLRAASEDGTGSLTEVEEAVLSPAHPTIPPTVNALSWQAIGLAQAHWSRVTFDAASRTEIQTKAIRCLKKSLSSEYGRSKDVRSLFALGLLLAERRELTPAIEIVKTALMSAKTQDDENHFSHGPYWQERSLIPLWHLLSLLLSARQEYVLAARACEGAFEQFKDAAVLFGNADLNFKSEHLNEVEAKNEKDIDARRGLVDDMEDFEKESILEVKMTQLALVELLEGPDVAVNASFELLTLFARLFGNIQAKPNINPLKTAEVPKSSAGTLRSIKGSIFGRSDRTGRAARQVSMASEKSNMSSQSRPHTTQTTTSTAPTIQITQENGYTMEAPRSRRGPPMTTQRRRSESGRRLSLRKRDSSTSRRRTASTGPQPHHPTVVDGESFFTPDGDLQQSDFFTFSSKRQPSNGSSFSRGRTMSHLDSYISQKSKSTEYSEVSLDAIYTISNPLPIVQFSKTQERRQRSATLLRLWLMIAGFYRRAGMYEDCKGCIAEAQKLVQGLEAEFARDTSGSLTLRAAAWGERKCVEELWGDVWAEVRVSTRRQLIYADLGLAWLPVACETDAICREIGL
jgi:cargo-transport protein YPP1